ncbi:scoloptoxin SSD552-like [Anopheles aquasalis]|uniref:scoloptoxin SSD552-like n=1 Tax=Anopheles aquasalis TaxID=42839 RepID=UPI00215A0F5A|nr:scoloptoxin SSD552-like [Anopheles aquasalis]XP_050092135.1 scoloptoxin SSD552-like [Anopheles aquasalis]
MTANGNMRHWCSVSLLLVGVVTVASGFSFGRPAAHSASGYSGYCAPSLCPHGGPNVGCNPPPLAGGGHCYGKGASVLQLDGPVRGQILHLHNLYRSHVASGKQSPLPPASNMAALVWDEELATQAGHNARSCVFAHDRCRNTPQYPYSGQNLSLMRYYGTSYTIDDLIARFINGWWSEFKATRPAYIEAFPRSQTKKIGHFTQIVSDRTTRIGCAMQTWEEGLWRTVYFVCNYSFTNIVGQQVYTAGPTGAHCSAGLDPTYPGLCRHT